MVLLWDSPTLNGPAQCNQPTGINFSHMIHHLLVEINSSESRGNHKYIKAQRTDLSFTWAVKSPACHQKQSHRKKILYEYSVKLNVANSATGHNQEISKYRRFFGSVDPLLPFAAEQLYYLGVFVIFGFFIQTNVQRDCLADCSKYIEHNLQYTITGTERNTHTRT